MNPDLLKAFSENDKSKIKELINLRNASGLTPLLDYLLNETVPDPKTVEKMLENGADVNIYHGNKPFLIELFLEKPKINPEIVKTHTGKRKFKSLF